MLSLGRNRTVDAQALDATRDAHWHEDLRTFATELPRLHIAPWAFLQKPAFDAAVARVDSAIPMLTDADIQVQLARLAAMLRDGHTSVSMPAYTTRLPVALYWFDNGPYITAATPDYKRLVGARIVGVGDYSLASVADTLRQYFSHENEFGFRFVAPLLLGRPAFLKSSHLIADSSVVSLDLEFRDGTRERVGLPAVTAAGLSLPPAADSIPVYQQRPRDKYWFRYLADSRTMFVKYNQCIDAADFRRMVDSVAHLIDSVGPERLVVDIRNNGGGDSKVLEPLLDLIRSRDALNKKEKLFVVMGRQTFSSGLLAAYDFRKKTHATLVGEPAGERTDNYGEVKTFTLPNSKIEVRYSTKHFKLTDKSTHLFEPDVSVPPTVEGALAGRDVALDWILKKR